MKQRLKSFFPHLLARLMQVIDRFPILVFGLGLLLLFGVIAFGSTMRQPEQQPEPSEPLAKAVQTYAIGQAPTVSFQAQVEKSGVVTLVAQTSGVVQSVYVRAGQQVNQGAWILNLSTNYQGGNAAALQTKSAYTQFAFSKDTFELQQDIINKNRELAEQTDKNNDELRAITEDSIDRTRDLIDLNTNSLEIINDLIEYQEDLPPAGTDALQFQQDSQLLSLKQQKSSILNGLSAAEQALNNSEYTVDQDNPPAQLSDLQRQVTLAQLDLERKTLNLNLETAELNWRIAQVNEALMYPAAPFSGTVERVYVTLGEVVSPGTALATLRGTHQSITLVALLPRELAQQVSRLDATQVYLPGYTIEAFPYHVAQEPTDDDLFAALFSLDMPSQSDQIHATKGGSVSTAYQDAIARLTDGQYLTMDIPIGVANTSAVFPFIPIDSVYQTQDTAFVYVVNDGQAVSRQITLGEIFGRFVEVQDGLEDQDQVITNRNVIAGDRVSTSIN